MAVINVHVVCAIFLNRSYLSLELLPVDLYVTPEIWELQICEICRYSKSEMDSELPNHEFCYLLEKASNLSNLTDFSIQCQNLENCLSNLLEAKHFRHLLVAEWPRILMFTFLSFSSELTSFVAYILNL